MPSSKAIKGKIRATQRTNQVTRAMEAVSAVKMRKSQQTALAGRPYAHAAVSLLGRLATTSSGEAAPLFPARAEKGLAVLLITSDKGLAGSVNSALLRSLERELLASTHQKAEVEILAVGKKGQEYFATRGWKIVESHSNGSDGVPPALMREVTHELSERYLRGEFREAWVAYANFKSTFEHVPTVRTLLPLTEYSLAESVKDILPVRGRFSAAAPLPPPAAYRIEPSPEEVLATLSSKLLAVRVYHALLEAKASEHSSRMVAMKSASDKSKEVAKALTRRFNKIRQAAITREVSEIIGGIEALRV